MKKTVRKQTEYFTLENMDGHIYCGANTLRIAKKPLEMDFGKEQR